MKEDKRIFSKMANKPRQGFSLAEMLVSLALMGALASMLLPMLTHNVGKDKLMYMGKDGAAELVQAYATYLKTNVPTANTSAQDIINNLNYMRIINNGSQTLQVEKVNNTPAYGSCTSGGNPCTVFTAVCRAETPCALLHSGALIQYDANATFGGNPPRYNTNALRFILDPDADGPQTSVSFVLFYSGRLSTRPYAQAAVLTNDDLANTTVDPEYLIEWTDG